MPEERKGKSSYEPPIAIPLGELARPEGAACRNGTNANAACHNGSVASGSCKTGAEGNPPGATAPDSSTIDEEGTAPASGSGFRVP